MYNHGDYCWIKYESGEWAEAVQVDENFGDGRYAVRFVGSETVIVTDGRLLGDGPK